MDELVSPTYEIGTVSMLYEWDAESSVGDNNIGYVTWRS